MPGTTRLLTFLKESKTELKKVSWPAKDQLVKLTGLVIFISLVVGIYVSALDWTLSKGLESMLQR